MDDSRAVAGVSRGSKLHGRAWAQASIAHSGLAAVLFSVIGATGCVSSKGCPENAKLASGACSEDSEAETQDGAAGGDGSDGADGGPVLVGSNGDAGTDSGGSDAGGSDAGSMDAGGGTDAAIDGGPCDGAKPTYCWEDADEDGYAPLGAGEILSCKRSCPAETTKREPTLASSDCRPLDRNAHPGAVDVCNDLNDDCDTSTDEGASATCDLDQATGACTGGVCKVGACEDGYADCDADDATGCEQALNVAGSCGACGVACHALASCDDSTATGACSCDAPHFGDGDSCEYTGAAALGNQHTCAIKSDRTVSCWGSDGYDQSSPPTDTFTQVSSGIDLSCGLKTNGGIACWGQNAATSAAPPATGEYVQVVNGGAHGCALQVDRTAICWGSMSWATGTPTGTFRQLAAGASNTCGLRDDGAAVCWGGGTADICTASECRQSITPDPLLHKFVQLTAGYVHTCGLKADGSVLCWGAGATDTNVYPQYGQSAPPGGVLFTYISAGWFHTCGVTTSGSIICWGAGDYDGTDNAYHKRQAFAPAGTYLRVYAGAFHTCALTSTLAMKCWGDNAQGQAPASVAGTWPLTP